MYTQRPRSDEPPTNKRFDIEQFMDFILAEWQLVQFGQLSYIHYQTSASQDWTIAHGLGRPVNFRCMDSDENTIIGAPIDDTINQISIHFTVPVEGIAIIT